MHQESWERTGGRQVRRNALGVGNWVSCDAGTRQQQNVTPSAAGWPARGWLMTLIHPDRSGCLLPVDAVACRCHLPPRYVGDGEE